MLQIIRYSSSPCRYQAGMPCLLWVSTHHLVGSPAGDTPHCPYCFNSELPIAPPPPQYEQALRARPVLIVSTCHRAMSWRTALQHFPARRMTLVGARRTARSWPGISVRLAHIRSSVLPQRPVVTWQPFGVCDGFPCTKRWLTPPWTLLLTSIVSVGSFR